MRAIPDIHYDARHGWFRWSANGHPAMLTLRNDPFTDADEAIRYALKQLTNADGIAMWAVVTNARAALEWALAKNAPGR
jgi:hypothetical protein